MARKSRRKRKMRQRNAQAVVMTRLTISKDTQCCPECQTSIIGSPIDNRICWKCSPEASKKQLKAHNGAGGRSEDAQTSDMDIPSKSSFDAVYDTKDAYLRKLHKEHDITIPQVFIDWRIYFFSRGSALREWQSWLQAKTGGHARPPVTDMTPHNILEQKILERRQANGTSGPNWRTEVTPAVIPRWSEPYKPVRKEPAIAAPSGDAGYSHVVI